MNQLAIRSGIPSHPEHSKDQLRPGEVKNFSVKYLLNDVYRAEIEQLFHEGRKIKDIRQIMIDEHNVTAS